jgi:hypothetical protein
MDPLGRSITVWQADDLARRRGSVVLASRVPLDFVIDVDFTGVFWYLWIDAMEAVRGLLACAQEAATEGRNITCLVATIVKPRIIVLEVAAC